MTAGEHFECVVRVPASWGRYVRTIVVTVVIVVGVAYGLDVSALPWAPRL